MIPFNKPYLSGNELTYIQHAVESGKISGDGMFTQKCHQFFEEKYGFKKVLLTSSCTDALEMAAILLDIQAGDEIIAPSYTFVSTVNAFVLRGATIVFVDCGLENPNMDVSQIEALITPKTKGIVVVHYAGIACNMDAIMKIANRHELKVVEDAAQCIDSYYRGKPLGSFGQLAAFSFHETKNIISGEGGMLCINDQNYIHRAEIIREKGTNRSAFFRGGVDKYSWVDIGSSFLPSDMVAAFLYAQLENLERLQQKRIGIWETYYTGLSELAKQGFVVLPHIPKYATNNAHIFYLVCNSITERTNLMSHLKAKGIQAIFHYQPLHSSPYFQGKYTGAELTQTAKYSDCLLRLPLFYELEQAQVAYIVECVHEFYKNQA